MDVMETRKQHTHKQAFSSHTREMDVLVTSKQHTHKQAFSSPPRQMDVMDTSKQHSHKRACLRWLGKNDQAISTYGEHHDVRKTQQRPTHATHTPALSKALPTRDAHD